MIIALNTRCLNKDEPCECGKYISEVFQRIIKLYATHTFIFISAKPLELSFNLPENVIPVVIGPQKSTPAQLFIWYNIKIPFLLKKYKADVFVTTGACSLTTKVPQCLILQNLSFLYFPSFVKNRYLSFYKRHTLRFVKKSKAIITVSAFAKAAIAERYKLPQNKIQVAYPDVDEIFQPVSIPERESIKEKYADGNEYFIYSGEISHAGNLINLLKAFSAFKKRQKSTMQLLISDDGKSNYDMGFFKSLESYKFRNDVKLFPGLSQSENVKVIASAYAMVYTPLYVDFGTSLLKAIKCEVPIIASSTGVMPEICGDAALYVDVENFKELAIKMMLIFKDEKLRKELIEKGKKQAQKFCWNNTAKLVWNAIEKTSTVENDHK